MTKKPLFEILFAVVVFAGTPLFLLHKPPEAGSTPVKAAAPAAKAQPKAAATGTEAKAEEKKDASSPALAHLPERNIFAENGTYIVPKDPKAQGKTAQEPRLLGITNTGMRRAFIIDPFGALLDLKAGDKVEGLEVKKITNTSVFLRMGNKDLELKVFAPPAPGTVRAAAATPAGAAGPAIVTPRGPAGPPQQPAVVGEQPRQPQSFILQRPRK